MAEEEFAISNAAVESLLQLLSHAEELSHDDNDHGNAFLSFVREPLADQELALTLLLTSVKDEPLLALLRFFAEQISLSHQIVLFLLEGLRRCTRLGTLDRASRLLVEQALLPQLAAPQGPSWGALLVLENVLLGYQHSPQLFFLAIPFLVSALHHLELNASFEQLQFLQECVCCLLDLWSGNDSVTAPLAAAVAAARSEHPTVKLRKLQREKRWIQSPDDLLAQSLTSDSAETNSSASSESSQTSSESSSSSSSTTTEITEDDSSSPSTSSSSTSSSSTSTSSTSTSSSSSSSSSSLSIVKNPLLSHWIGGEWDTSCGNMVLQATESSVFAQNAVGYVHWFPVSALKDQAPLEIGSKGLLRCQNHRYYPGSITDAFRGLFKFKCDSGISHWVFSEYILRPDDCPSEGELRTPTQVLARANYSTYYERGILVQPTTALEISDSKLVRNEGSLLVRWDNMRTDWVPRNRIYVGYYRNNLSLSGTSSPSVFATALHGLTYQSQRSGDQDGGTAATYDVMEGTVKPANYATRGTFSLTFPHSPAVFSGRWNHGSHADHWIGVRYQPVSHFSSAHLPVDSDGDRSSLRTAEIFQFNGADTLVEVGGQFLFSFSGQQAFTFEASLMLKEVGRKMVIFNKSEEHGLYITEEGRLAYWRRVITSATSSALLVETLLAQGDDSDSLLLAPHQLYHLSLVYDGIHAFLLINRKVAACNEMRPISAPDAPHGLHLGGALEGGKPVHLLNGVLLFIKFWACARPTEKLAAISPGLDEAQPLPEELVGFWPMVSYLPLLADVSRFGNHGFVSSAHHRGFPHWNPLQLDDDTVINLRPFFHSEAPELQMVFSGLALPPASGCTGIRLPASRGTPNGSCWSTRPLMIHQGFTMKLRFSFPSASSSTTSSSSSSGSGKNDYCFCFQISDLAPYSPIPFINENSPSIFFQVLLMGSFYTVRACQTNKDFELEELAEANGLRFHEINSGWDMRLQYRPESDGGRFQLWVSDLKILTFPFAGSGPSKISASTQCYRFGVTSGDVVGLTAARQSLARHFHSILLQDWEFESTCYEPSALESQVRTDLQLFLSYLVEFERALKTGTQNTEWKFLRQKWYDDVRQVNTVRGANGLLRRLARSLILTDWRRDEKSRWNSDCRRAQTISELVEAILTLESILGSKSFHGEWYSDKGAAFTSAMNHIRMNEFHRTQHNHMLNLKAATKAREGLCRLALLRNNSDPEKALEWLSQPDNLAMVNTETRRHQVAEAVAHQDHWNTRIKVGPAQKPQKPDEEADDDGQGPDGQQAGHNWTGFWWSNRGVVSFTQRSSVEAKLAKGTFRPHGRLRGFLFRNMEGAWRFMGSWTDNIQTLPQACAFDFSQTGTSFTGWSNTDTVVSVWHGHRPDHSKPYAVGLVNTGNSCYQNAFLQALNTTKSLRDQVLSGQFLVGPGSNAAWKLLERLQHLFSKLSYSQRQAADPEIKPLLMSPYNGNRQHDSFEFGTYLLDTLMEQLRPTPLNGLIENVYGGTQINVKRCCVCSETSTRGENFTFLSVPFPSNYRPITDIRFVSGKHPSIGAPPGYSRISVNLNEGRSSAPYIYMCVRRDRHEMPITDLKLVVLEDPALLPQKITSNWEAINFDLNPDSKNHVFLLVRRSPTGSPITEVAVTTDSTVPDGFKKLDVDLNSDSGGKYIYLCIKRTNPIKNIVVVTAPTLKKALRRTPAGYDLIEVNLSLEPSGLLFLATTSAGVLPPLTSVEFLHDPEFNKFDLLVTADNPLDQPSDIEFYLNIGPERYLRCSRGHGCPIKILDVFRAPHPPPRHGYEIVDLLPHVGPPALPPADAEGVDHQAAQDALHEWAITGSFRMENTDHLQFSLFEGDYWRTVWIFSGTLSRSNGKVNGFLFENEERRLFRGRWTNTLWKHSQPLSMEFDASWSAFEGVASTGDTSQSISGLKSSGTESPPRSSTTSLPAPPSPILDAIPKPGEPLEFFYVDLIVVPVGEEVPPNYEIMTIKPVYMWDPELKDGGHIYFLKAPAEECDNRPIITDATIIYTELEPLPEGYKAVTKSPHGSDATLKCGAGDGRRLSLCFKTETSSSKVARGIYISFNWGDTIPNCYRRLMRTNDFHLEANLSTNELDILGKRYEYVYLLVWTGGRYEHPIVGEWETTLGVLTLQVDGKSRGRRVKATYGSSGNNLISGVYLQSTREIHATYREANNANTACCGFSFADDQWRRLLGHYVYADVRGSWLGWKDIFMQIGMQKDYLCQWRNGEEVFSVAGENNHIESLFSQAFCPELMAGSNRVSCSKCNDLRDTERYTCISRPPPHLILTLKRFAYDYRSGRTDKLLHKVEFGPTLSLPACPPELVSSVFETPEDHQLQLQNKYGLYAVVVHAGTKLDGGHYYTYARDPNSLHLSEEDDPDNAPWCRYDDQSVTVTDWKSWKEQLWSSIDNSEYLLFYRRLDLPLPQPLVPESKVAPLSAIDSVVQHNIDHLAATNRKNSSLQLLQEIEIDTRLKRNYIGPFPVPAHQLLQQEDLLNGLTFSPLTIPKPSTPLPEQYAGLLPTECPHCHRLFPASDLSSHFIEPDSCVFASKWIIEQPASSDTSSSSSSSSSSAIEGGEEPASASSVGNSPQISNLDMNQYDYSPFPDDSTDYSLLVDDSP